MNRATHHALPVRYPVCTEFVNEPAHTMYEVTFWGGRYGTEPVTRYCAALSPAAAAINEERPDYEIRPLFCLHCNLDARGNEGFDTHNCDDTTSEEVFQS